MLKKMIARIEKRAAVFASIHPDVKTQRQPGYNIQAHREKVGAARWIERELRRVERNV